MIRLIVVTNIPSPYQVDLLAALAEAESIDLHVIFCAASEYDRQFERRRALPFSATTLSSWRIPGTPKDWHRQGNLASVLDEQPRPDVAVLSGSYFMPAVTSARRWLARRNVPWFYWGESPQKRRSSRLWQSLRSRHVSAFLGTAAGVLAVGSRACAAYRPLLGSDRPIYNVPYAPDLSALLNPAPSWDRLARQLRDQWEVADPVVALFSGRLCHRKAPDVLLQALAILAEDVPSLCVQFVGDGPMRGWLQSQAARLGLADRVRIEGFLHGDALRAAYLSADLFVLPTRAHEGWGVVVSEAMAAGLPAIVSQRVGCGPDLIEPGLNGHIVSPDEPERLAELLAELACSVELRRCMGDEARRTAHEVNAPRIAGRIVEALTHAAAESAALARPSAAGPPPSGCPTIHAE